MRKVMIFMAVILTVTAVGTVFAQNIPELTGYELRYQTKLYDTYWNGTDTWITIHHHKWIFLNEVMLLVPNRVIIIQRYNEILYRGEYLKGEY